MACCGVSLTGEVDRFFRSDNGAVSVDWVGLTAGIAVIGVSLTYALFDGGVASTAHSINAALEATNASVSLSTDMEETPTKKGRYSQFD